MQPSKVNGHTLDDIDLEIAKQRILGNKDGAELLKVVKLARQTGYRGSLNVYVDEKKYSINREKSQNHRGKDSGQTMDGTITMGRT